MVLGISLPLLDTTLINVATPALCIHFAASLVHIQWVTTAYTLATVAIIPLCGWAANRYGAKALWLCGLL
jgi:MFS family permease